jgi:hypothetical protein
MAGPTPEAVSAEATRGAILSSEDILIGCDLASRSCSPKTDIRPNQQSEGTGNKGDLTWRKSIIRLLNICPARYRELYLHGLHYSMVNGKYGL